MADTTPLINQINVDLSLRLNDPTSGADNGIKAATNGGTWSAAQRNHYCNNACRAIVHELVNRFGEERAGEIAQCMKTQSITFSSSGVSLNKDYLSPVRLVKSSGSPFVKRKKSDLDIAYDKIVSRAYAIEGGKLYAYERSSGTLSILNSGTGTFYYIFAERKDSNGADVAVNTAPDIILEQGYHEAITTYACGLALYDKGVEARDQGLQGNGTNYMKLAFSMLPNVPS